jgi:hypothetical protein
MQGSYDRTRSGVWSSQQPATAFSNKKGANLFRRVGEKGRDRSVHRVLYYRRPRARQEWLGAAVLMEVNSDAT